MKNEKDQHVKSKIKFKVNSNNRMRYIESDKVLFLEGHNNYTFLHTQKEKFVCADQEPLPGFDYGA